MKVSIKTADVEVEVESNDNTLTDLTTAAIALLREVPRPKKQTEPELFGFSISAETERVPELVNSPCLD